MNIVPIFDSSAQDAPAGFKIAVQAAIDFYDQMILNPITVKITFSYGEIEGSPLSGGALAESDTNGYIEPYSQVVSWLTASATSQADAESLRALPATDPTDGGRFWVSDSEAKVFGASSDPNFTDPEDGFSALSSTAPFSFDPTNRAIAGDYDAIGAMEHEISEALGRISYLGQSAFDGFTLYSPLDLFRYSSPGVHDLKAQAGFFSVDGQNLLLEYNNPHTGDDGGDWNQSAVGDSYGFGSMDTAGVVSPTDLLEMNVLGFLISAPASDDFNGDQKSDFLIENTAGAVVVGEVGASGVAATTQVGALGPEWSFHGAGDFLGDGNTGFLIQNTAGAVVVGEVVDGNSSYTTIAGLGSEWSFHGVGDFLGSGKSDFLIENTAGQVVVGEVSGGQAGYTTVGALGPEWKFVGSGDFNGDSITDFLIENTAGAVVVGEVTNGQAVYTQVAALGAEWKFEGVGDFLGDGVDQFLIENTAGTVAIGHVIDGTATYTDIANLGPEWKFEGVGYFLGEGHEQFLIENASGVVDVGDYSNGQIHYTQVASLGAEWMFHL